MKRNKLKIVNAKSDILNIMNNYIADGKAIIPIESEKIEDLFMKHDFKKLDLSDEICDYIEKIAHIIPMNTGINIGLHRPKVNEEMQIKMVKAIKNNYGMDIDDINYDINKINFRALILGLVGCNMGNG